MSQDKKVVFITGANTGLGLEIVKALYKSTQPYDIIAGSRLISNGEAAVAAVQQETPSSPSSLSELQLDLASDESIKKAVENIEARCGRLDVLVNNGGACFDGALRDGQLSIREAWHKSWDTNVAGTQVLTSEAVPLLLRSGQPRLLFITSGTSALGFTERFDHPALQRINASPKPGWPKPEEINPIESYRSAKTGLNMMMRQWHRILLNDGVKVWAISPGFLATGLGNIGIEQMRKMGARDPSEGGSFVKGVIEGERDSEVGKVVGATGVQTW
ncbi:Short-chain dehydrogenase/reductase tropE [Lachnellula cervina]|uniref:Short-chain dehydrogenase/reductase tropE n=1 Tax=Lachnellula cervina TaxID=1316786 RepID=A0A7D8YKS0_9HELO|nr:Short-chain dehydrogenase/reductase tropE [Lachnellula cervina]